MKLIMRDRGQGKTLELIHTSEITRARIITATETAAKYIKEQAENLGLNIPDPIPATRYQKMGRMLRDEYLLVDNVETVLADALYNYLGRPVI